MKPQVDVLLTNRWATFNCDPEIQVRLKRYFRYEAPGSHFSEAFRTGQWDGFHYLLQRGRVSAALFNQRQKELAKKFDLRISDHRQIPKFKDLASEGLRPYQIAGLKQMIAASSSGGIVLVATGAGKTRMAGAYFKRLIGAGVFICDELALLEQSRKALEAEIGEEIGVVGQGKFNPARITVATSQTLHRHRNKKEFRKWFKTIAVTITDELHVEINQRSVEIIQQIAPQASFGLTATLELEKAHIRFPAIALYGPVVFRYPIHEGVEEGYLSRGVVCQVEFWDPLVGKAPAYATVAAGGDGLETKVWIEAGSPPAEYRRRICLNKARNESIEGIIREGLKRGRKVVCLVDWKLHLKTLDRRFQDIPHYSLSGEVQSSTRLEAMKKMDTGELSLILASKVFAKGVDVSTVDMILDASGLPSRNNALQRYGRGTRKGKGKSGLIYIDIADRGNCFSSASHARLSALRQIKAPILTISWNHNPETILDQSLAVLSSSTSS